MAALTLTAALRRMGEGLAPEDRSAVLARSNHYRTHGIGTREAAIRAIQDHLAAIDAALEQMGAPAEPVSQPEAAMPPQSHAIPPQLPDQDLPQQ